MTAAESGKKYIVNEKKYSVLMPLFYKEKVEYLQLSLESMLNQTLPPSEIVMIEDHPVSDEMKQTIRSLSNKYGIDVNIYSNYELDGKGLAAVLAYGVCKCKNELIARMDTDDISFPDRCEKEVELLLAHPEYSIVGTWVEEFDGVPENVITIRTTPAAEDEIIKRFKYTNPFNHPSVMFKKSAILKAGNYDVNSIADEDYDLWYRVYKCGYRGTNIQESLLKFRMGDSFVKRRRTKKAFLAKTGIKKTMYMDKFMSFPEYFVGIAMEYVYLYCPIDIRKILFEIARKKSIKWEGKRNDYNESTL